MSYPATVFNVMISSPSDVIAEKKIATDVIYEINQLFSDKDKIVLLPRMWETHSFPIQGERPQEIINKTVLRDSDVLIAIFWTRIGTPTGNSASGSIEEIEEHISFNKPALIYFSSVPVIPGSIDADQYKKLLDFKEIIKNKGLYKDYSDHVDFKNSLLHNLIHLINNHEYFGVPTVLNILDQESIIDNTSYLISSMPEIAKLLLKEASKSADGNILVLRMLGGTVFQVNNKGYQPGNNRDEAPYLEAIKHLTINELIEDVGYENEIFRVTALGYVLADKLPDSN